MHHSYVYYVFCLIINNLVFKLIFRLAEKVFACLCRSVEESEVNKTHVVCGVLTAFHIFHSYFYLYFHNLLLLLVHFYFIFVCRLHFHVSIKLSSGQRQIITLFGDLFVFFHPFAHATIKSSICSWSILFMF